MHPRDTMELRDREGHGLLGGAKYVALPGALATRNALSTIKNGVSGEPPTGGLFFFFLGTAKPRRAVTTMGEYIEVDWAEDSLGNPVPTFHIIVLNNDIGREDFEWEVLQHEVSHYAGLPDRYPPPTAYDMMDCGERNLPKEKELGRLEGNGSGGGGSGGGGGGLQRPEDMDWDEWLCKNFGIRCPGEDDDDEEEEEEPIVGAELGEIEVVCVVKGIYPTNWKECPES